jgi:hypothetical protein
MVMMVMMVKYWFSKEWLVYYALIFSAFIASIVVSGSIMAGAIAMMFTVLGTTWGAVMTSRDHARNDDE